MSKKLRGAVVGTPISHSLSPLLHREAFAFLGIDGSYDRHEVPAGGLSQFLSREGENFDYISITMPLKEEALELPVSVDSRISRIQSANTLYRVDGNWNLTSTDGSGFIAALANAGYLDFKKALVLGAGGTARAVVGALDGVAQEIVVLGRTSTRREVLENSIEKSQFDYQRWRDNPDFDQYDLVVNTTPAGAADLLADAIQPGDCRLLFDVIYKPWPTVLASRWSDSDGDVINGLELLLYQGIQQLSLAIGDSIDELALATHLRPILRKAIR